MQYRGPLRRGACAPLRSRSSNSSNARVRRDVALAIIERGYGKPTQPTAIFPPDGVQCEVALTGLDELGAPFEAKRRPKA
jgi:hypothetical protein